MKRCTGAVRAEVFTHTIRKCLPTDPKAQTTVQRLAVMLVHSDCTVTIGLQRVHRFRWRQLVQVQLLFSRAMWPWASSSTARKSVSLSSN